MKLVRIKLYSGYLFAQHNYPAQIAVIAANRKIKIEGAPQTQTSGIIALEPDTAQINILIQQLNTHGFAVVTSGYKRTFPGHKRPAYIEAHKEKQKEPKEACQIQHEEF